MILEHRGTGLNAHPPWPSWTYRARPVVAPIGRFRRPGYVVAMQPIRDAILAGASGDELAALPLPESYRAAVVLASEQEMFAGLESSDKDPRKSLHVQEVPVPELAPDEAVHRRHGQLDQLQHRVDVDLRAAARPSASSSAWARRARGGPATTSPSTWWARDASGVVLRVGSAVRNWKPGDRVVVHCNYVDDQDPSSHNDSMLAGNQRIWGFETNYGGLADLVDGQGQPADAQARPPHVGGGGGQRPVQLDQLPHAGEPQRRRHEAGRRRADLGRDRRARRLRRAVRAQRRRHARSGWSRPPRRARSSEAMGCEAVIDRKAAGYRFWSDEFHQDESEWRRLGKDVRGLDRPRSRDRVRAPRAARPSVRRCSSPPAAARSSPAPPPAAT